MSGGVVSSASDDDGGGFRARCASSSKTADQVLVGQRLAELGAGAIPPAFEFLDDQCDAAVQSGRIQALLAVDRLIQLLNSWGRDLQDPTDVLGGHKVPGWAQDVRPEEVPAVELGLHLSGPEPRSPHAKRPKSMGILLRLHAAEQPDDVCCARKPLTLQHLGCQAAFQHILSRQLCHDAGTLAGHPDTTASARITPAPGRNSDSPGHFVDFPAAGLTVA